MTVEALFDAHESPAADGQLPPADSDGGRLWPGGPAAWGVPMPQLPPSLSTDAITNALGGLATVATPTARWSLPWTCLGGVCVTAEHTGDVWRGELVAPAPGGLVRVTAEVPVETVRRVRGALAAARDAWRAARDDREAVGFVPVVAAIAAAVAAAAATANASIAGALSRPGNARTVTYTSNPLAEVPRPSGLSVEEVREYWRQRGADVDVWIPGDGGGRNDAFGVAMGGRWERPASAAMRDNDLEWLGVFLRGHNLPVYQRASEVPADLRALWTAARAQGVPLATAAGVATPDSPVPIGSALVGSSLAPEGYVLAPPAWAEGGGAARAADTALGAVQGIGTAVATAYGGPAAGAAVGAALGGLRAGVASGSAQGALGGALGGLAQAGAGYLGAQGGDGLAGALGALGGLLGGPQGATQATSALASPQAGTPGAQQQLAALLGALQLLQGAQQQGAGGATTGNALAATLAALGAWGGSGNSLGQLQRASANPQLAAPLQLAGLLGGAR